MSSFWSLFAANLVMTAVMALVVALAGRWTPVRAHPRLRHALWLLVVAKLLTPPVFQCPVLPWIIPEAGHNMDRGEPNVAQPLPWRATKAPQPSSARSHRAAAHEIASNAEPVRTALRSAAPAVRAPPPRSLFLSLLALVSLPTAFLLARCLWQIRRIEQLVAQAAGADQRLARIVTDACRRMGLTTHPDVRLVAGRLMPFLWVRFGRPTIVLPAALVDRLHDDQVEFIVCHELAHFLRRDHWSNTFALAVAAGYWWFPVAWWARRELVVAQEQCCDALVIRSGGISSRRYAETLFAAIEFINDERLLPALASGFGRVTAVRRRFEMIASQKVSPRFPVLSAALALLVVSAFLSLPVRGQPARQAADEQPAVADRNQGGGAVQRTESKQRPTDEPAATTRKVSDSGSIKETVDEKVAPQATTALRTNILRYSGQSFDEWRAKLLNDLDPQNIVEAMKPIAAFGRMGYAAEAVEALSEVMKTDRALDEDGIVATQAAEALAKIGAEGTPALIDGLADRRPRIRGACAKVVGTLGAAGQPATDALIGLLDDEAELVRRIAVTSLVALGGDNVELQPTFERLAKSDETEVRKTFVTAMRSHPPKDDWWVGLFLRLVDDEDWEIRAVAGQTLATHGPAEKRVIQALEGLIVDNAGGVSDYTLSSLVHSAPPEALALFLADACKHPDIWSRLSNNELKRLIDRLCRAPNLGAATVPLLIKIVEMKTPSWCPNDVVAAMDGLGRFGPAARSAIPALERWAARKYILDAENAATTRSHASRALQRIRGEEAEEESRSLPSRKPAAGTSGTPAAKSPRLLAESRRLLVESRAAQRADQPDNALELASKAIELGGENARLSLLHRGTLYAALRRHEEALADLDRAVALTVIAKHPGTPSWIDPSYAGVYELRGSERFKVGRFADSIADFDRQIALDPTGQMENWRRGISCYFAGQYAQGRKQFEAYQTVDNNDVENAVWRFMCMAHSDGVAAARDDLLKIEHDRRVPMMEIYSLFAGRAVPEQVLAAARAGTPAADELRDRLFYAEFYLGLYYDAHGDWAQARRHLEAAVEQEFKGYMWDVAKARIDLLAEEKPDP